MIFSSSKDNQQATIHYGDGDFAMIKSGSYVVCTMTGKHIPIAELRYWSVERQEAYVDADASFKAYQAARK